LEPTESEHCWPRSAAADWPLETGAVERQADPAVVHQQAERGVNTLTMSSRDRSLDVVSALVGACDHRIYEGEPAQRLKHSQATGRHSQSMRYLS